MECDSIKRAVGKPGAKFAQKRAVVSRDAKAAINRAQSKRFA